MPPAVDMVLSGPLCAGKSTLAYGLVGEGWHLVSAREVIAQGAQSVARDRRALQRIGDELEASRPGCWLAEAAAAGTRPVVLDAARTRPQLLEARSVLADCLVVYLDAPLAIRRARFAQRADRADSGIAFSEVNETQLERRVGGLASLADLVVDTRAAGPRDVLEQVVTAAAARNKGP
jgi:cytidylate kinase